MRWLLAKERTEGSSAYSVALKDNIISAISSHREDSAMMKVVTRFAVVDTQSRRRIELRIAVKVKWVRLCLHSEAM